MAKIRTICQACHCQCGVIVHVENEHVTKVTGDPSHPMNRGFICAKGKAQPSVLYHPDRLKYPQRRIEGKGGAKWERISWDEALDGIAERFSRIKEEYGSESIAVITGTGPRTGNNSAGMLANALCTPNKTSVDRHICFSPSVVAESATIGKNITTIMMELGPDYREANCIVVWGANPLASHPPRGMEIVQAKKQRDAKLIVIDPRRTELASMADLWLQIRPGTDVALAMGMIHVIIEEGLFDKEFIETWSYGFDNLKAHAKNFHPAKVAEITWVPAEKLREAARMYATTKPAAFHHRIGVEHNINSTQSNRAFSILIALSGNIDVQGGNLFQTLPEGFVHPFKKNKPGVERMVKRIGSKEFPLISGADVPDPFVHAHLLVEAMLNGTPYPVKALYCIAGNPVVTMQNSKRVWGALKCLDTLVVADFFMTPTAELSDYVLPATTWMEKDELGDFPNLMYTNYLAAGQKVIEPFYDCWDDRKIIIELMKRIPWAERRFLPWSNVDELNDAMAEGLKITYADLKKKGYVQATVKYKKYLKEGFRTPTGKVELYSTIFEKYGYDPLPTFHEPPHSPISTPELMKEYPLILITGGRMIEFFNTEGRWIPVLRDRVPNPEVAIHPETAKEKDIGEGDWVWIETAQVKGERVRFKAKLTTDIHPAVVHAPHGWWFPETPAPEHGCFESNINVVLTGDAPREPICGSVPTRGTLCKVYRAEAGSLYC